MLHSIAGLLARNPMIYYVQEFEATAIIWIESHFDSSEERIKSILIEYGISKEDTRKLEKRFEQCRRHNTELSFCHILGFGEIVRILSQEAGLGQQEISTRNVKKFYSNLPPVTSPKSLRSAPSESTAIL